MRLGLDFDNTLVCYDEVFFQTARDYGWISASCPPRKESVKASVIENQSEEAWTQLQGVVYGTRMEQASLFPGVRKALRWALDQGYNLYLISHKTRYPYLGPQYDLIAAAQNWISSNLRDDIGILIPEDQHFFEPSKIAKIDRILTLECKTFIDDLPEILEALPQERFQRVLFQPGSHQLLTPYTLMTQWQALPQLIPAYCPQPL